MSCSLPKGFKVSLNKILHKGFKTWLQSLDDPLGLFHPKQTDSKKIVWQAMGIQHREVSLSLQNNETFPALWKPVGAEGGASTGWLIVRMVPIPPGVLNAIGTQ